MRDSLIDRIRSLKRIGKSKDEVRKAMEDGSREAAAAQGWSRAELAAEYRRQEQALDLVYGE